MNWFKSTPGRFALFQAAMFSVLLIVLVSTIYVLASEEFEEDMTGGISKTVKRLKHVYVGKGADGLSAEVSRQMRASRMHGYFFDLRDADGVRLHGNLPDEVFQEGWGRTQFFEDPDDVEDNDPTTIITYGLKLDDGSTLVVGGNHERADDLIEVMLNASIWTLGLTVLFAISSGALILHWNLRRMALISDTSRAIMDGDLTQRIPIRGTNDEFDRLSININDMLQRIEELMETMHQVTNDIAHDMRTPLGRLRQNLERARNEQQSVEGLRERVDQAIVATDKIIETFNALLSIGAMEAGRHRAGFADVDMSALLMRLFESYEPVAQNNGQVLVQKISSGIHVRGNRQLLAQLVANLIENAVNHCPSGTAIVLRLRAEEPGFVFSLCDDGPGIPDDEKDRVLRPFYRLEKSRTSQGNGLGLAVVQVISRLHGFELALVNNNPGLCVELRAAQ